MSKLDLNSVCRLCVQFFEQGKVSPIFNNEIYNHTISLPERIKYCSAVEVTEDDGLPPQICNTCLSKLNQSFIFRNQCVLADITLKRLKDISFSVNDIPNLLKIDFENQIIQSGKDDFFHSLISDKLKNKKMKNKDKIDEFDNSKKGRHKRSIHKLKSVPLQKTKIQDKKIDVKKNDVCDEREKNVQKSSPIMDLERAETTVKNYPEEEVLNKDKLTETRKFKRVKRVKQSKAVKDDAKVNTKIENLLVKPKLNSFSDNIGNFSSDSNTGEILNDCDADASKPDAAKSKRKKKIKVCYSKEKLSSYKCDYCQKVYPSEGGWRYHIHTMHNENYQPFICDLCGQAFKVKKNLEAHKNSIHFHLKLHLCDLCGRGFASKYALKVHKIWHNDEKNYTCDVCGTKFRTRGKMNTHRSIHGGPKKFMCHICSRDFRWKKDFEIHMRTHTGEKPFKCSHCGKAFASLTNMKKHEKNHLKKLETDETTEIAPRLDVVVVPPEGKLRRNEFLIFCNGLDDVRYNQVSQVSGTVN